MELTVQAILAAVWPAYERSRRIPGYLRQAAWRMLRCGTGELGWVVWRCPEGHVEEREGRACRHRACPRCRLRRARQWLEGWLDRLLPVEHFHVVLTIASELDELWRHNRRAMAEVLFSAGRETLLKLLAEPRHLGGVPGILLVLHTWSRALTLHPHLHCLVTAGGMRAGAEWKAIERGFLIHSRVLREVFRGVFLEQLGRAWAGGKIVLPPGWDEAVYHRQLRRAAGKKWCVRVEPPYRHGTGVVKYLARYVCGGPIGKSRLVGFDGERVTLVVGREESNPQTRTLGAQEFVRRLLDHVPVPGLRMVRGCGIYASARRRDRERLRAELSPTEEAAAIEAQRGGAAEAGERRTCCPQCGRELVLSEIGPLRRRNRGEPARAGPGGAMAGREAA